MKKNELHMNGLLNHKLILAVIVLCMSFFLTVPNAQAASSPTKKAVIKTEVKSKEYKSEDGSTYFTYQTSKPILSGNTKAVKAINRAIRQMTAAWSDDITNFEKDAAEMYEYYSENEQDYSMTPYAYETDFQVMFNDKGCLSLYFNEYSFSGGAHPNKTYVAATFDLKTGKKLALTDIMSGSSKTVRTNVYKTFETKIKKNPEMYFDDALTTVKNTSLANTSFYLNKKGLVLFYDTYGIAPYAAGVQEALIPYGSKLLKIKL